VPSWGMGVTSSIRPIRRPDLAKALIAGCAPGPGVLRLWPPGALTLMCTAFIPLSFAVCAALKAACMAAWGEDSYRPTLTNIPPEYLAMVSAPLKSVTWTMVLL
jgi:hypothetical protein